MNKNWREHPKLVEEYRRRVIAGASSAESAKRQAQRIDGMVAMLEGFYPPDPAESQAGRISPERASVYYAVAIAIRRGQITRPKECCRCWRACKPHAHHHDYSRPLEVTWLCSSCHALEHVAQRNAAFLASLRAEPA